MHKFLVEPLKSTDISAAIVAGALDESKEEEPESAVLLVLGKFVSEIPGVKFFITSRPETYTVAGFRGPPLKKSTDIFILHKVEPRTIDNNIRRFFRHELYALVQRRGGSGGWPTDQQLDLLCQRAAGFSVYAVATVNFLKHRFKRPSDRLVPGKHGSRRKGGIKGAR